MSNVNDTIKSYRRCIAQADFFDRFYANLFAADPNIEKMFANTNFAQQRTMIRKAMTTLIMRFSGVRSTDISLDRIAESHGKHGLGVTPAMYDIWIESMLKTIRECDPEWSPALEPDWQALLNEGIAYLIKSGRR